MTSTKSIQDIRATAAVMTEQDLGLYYIEQVNAAIETGRDDIVEELARGYERELSELAHRAA